MPAGGREMLLERGRGRGYPLAHTCALRYKLGPHTLRNYSQTRIPFESRGGDKQRRQSTRQQQHYSMSGREGEEGKEEWESRAGELLFYEIANTIKLTRSLCL